MLKNSLLRACLGALLLMAASACSHRHHHAAALPDAGSPADAGGGFSDFDGDIPLPRKHDAGTVAPGMPEPGLVGPCAIDSNKTFTAVTTDRPLVQTPMGVNLESSLFAIPYIGTSNGCLDAVYLTSLAGSPTAPAPASTLAIDDCSLPRSPVLTSAGGQWLLAFVDNHVPPYDVWVQVYDTKMKKMGAPQRVSDNPAVETATAIATLRDGNVMVAWADQATDGSGTLHVRPLDATGKPTGPETVIDKWNAAAGTDPTKNPKLTYGVLTLSDLGADGAAFAYWRFDPAALVRSEIVFVALDKTGKPVRPEWVLTKNAGPYAAVDVAVNSEGGALVYTQAESGSGRQLWFQQITDTGVAAPLRASAGTVAPVRFLNSPYRGMDVSITKLLASYAVVYRALPAANLTRPQIHLAFLNRVGNLAGDLPVSFTSESGGKTAVEAAYDGRVVIAWSETSDTGASAIKVGRVPCVGGP
ncbi:MAG TPA: hypothetical protein VF331_14550 [Polyangiales bacterium]